MEPFTHDVKTLTVHVIIGDHAKSVSKTLIPKAIKFICLHCVLLLNDMLVHVTVAEGTSLGFLLQFFCFELPKITFFGKAK